MTSPRNWSNVTVNDGTNTREHVNVQVTRRQTANIVNRESYAILSTRADVAAVRFPTRKTAVVEFADGSRWEVSDIGGCGCR